MTTRNKLTAFKYVSGTALALAAIMAFGLFTFSSEPKTKEPTPTQGELFQEEYNIFSLPVPDNPTFAGEPVPVERSYIRESLDRELLVNTYWQSQTLLFIKRAAKYFPVIEPILKEEGVPEDFKYLALAESGLIMRARSHAGAVGPWQFVSGAGRDYGLEINSEIDERYHLEKATAAACRFLKSSREKFGSWTLAAAAYNAGRSRIIRQLDRQKTNNYYDLLLNDETGRYVFRIIAIKEILEDPQNYGFHVKKKDLYYMEPTYTVDVDSTVRDFASFAHEYNLSYKELKDLNPWLRDDKLTNSRGKTYQIKIPEKGAFLRKNFQETDSLAAETLEEARLQ
ncbi:lytic transglycosylase domain-containing protein [Marinilabilia rubra]|uniref:Murein transglycosylase n=1 Tax=Marinilabilia rubra TaxID=2162893 RepID=A0A2U2B693_9BACT|nr:lytic transglycosylase domain-containing protein [Marinilabilia rubra]PWD98562.1 murein transglycosylase [Marinilabilia rubra]